MYSCATRTKREEEEAERLVRPAPKVKPPRRDRRREQVDIEPKEEEDPDQSLNYKNVGGSAKAVFLRWAKKKNIPVRNRETGEAVPGGVSPKTLRKDPGKYELLDEKETTFSEKKKKKTVREQQEPDVETGDLDEESVGDKPDEGKKKPDVGVEESGEKIDDEPKSDAEIAAEIASKWTAEKRHEGLDFQQYLDAIPTGDKDPLSGEVLVMDPKLKKRVPFDQLDPQVQADLIGQFNAQEEEKAKAAKTLKSKENKREAGKKASEYLSKLDPEIREALESLRNPSSKASKKLKEIGKGYNLKHIKVEKLFPELQGRIPEDLDNIGLAKKLVTASASYEALSEAEKAGVEAPKRRHVSESELKETLTYLMDNVPPEIATDMFSQGIHPDDAKTLVRSYKEALKNDVKNPSAFALEASDFYTEDPARVKPPEKWNGTPFEKLSGGEKAEALRQQQMHILAKSLAAKENLTKSLMGRGFLGGPVVPPILASTLASSMLEKRTGSEKAQKENSQKMAQIVFDSMMSDGQHFPIRDRAITDLMSKLDPYSQTVARGFFQANDYFGAKKKYLKGGASGTDEDAVSEFSSSGAILKGLRKANEFMQERARLYGGGNVTQRLFRTRVMDRLRTLAPDKYAKIQPELDEQEAREYERAHQEWERDHKQWRKRKKTFESKAKGHPYRSEPAEFNEPEPVEPVEPLRYEGQGHKKQGSGGEDLWKSVFGREQTAFRVANRYTSIYPSGLTMGSNNRITIYHGIEPDSVEPYPEWQQVHQRDLGEFDFSQILNTAKKWLQAPVLEGMDGVVPDVKLRAALDHALGKYSRAINPVLYNQLLARLAGIPKPGLGQTLQTIQGSTCKTLPFERREVMAVKTAEQSKYASEILTRLDKLAEDIQKHHDAWGMTMKAAKGVVNHLDSVADDFEKAAFGENSLQRRQQEILAAVIQRDSDEPYMDNFRNPQQPEQTDADEPYMSAYNDDQSSAVEMGRVMNGRPLVP